MSIHYFLHKGNTCHDPPAIPINKQNLYFGGYDLPSFFQKGNINPVSGNITLLQTGKMYSPTCPGSNNVFRLLPVAPNITNICENNRIMARLIQPQVDVNSNWTNLRQYEILVINDKSHSPMTIMMLLTFSNDVSAETLAFMEESKKVSVYCLSSCVLHKEEVLSFQSECIVNCIFCTL